MSKIYKSKEIIVEGKKVQAVYLDGIIEKTFDIRDDKFVEDHNDFIDYLKSKGYMTEKQRRRNK